MQPDALEVAQLPVERLADERVGEAVPCDRARHLVDDAYRDRFLEDLEQPLLLDVAHSLEHVEAELLADDGGEREPLGARIAQAGEPVPDDLPDALGEMDLARLDPAHPLVRLAISEALVEDVPQDLLDEEWIARCLPRERAGKVL